MLWRYSMTSPREMRKINRLVEIILKEKTISKVRLVMQSGISISYYEKLKPFLEELYSHRVQYDKFTTTWKAIEQQNENNDE